MSEPITHFNSVKTKSDNKFHIYPTLRIVLIAQGAIKWLIGSKEYLCNEGDVIFFNNSTERRITEVVNNKAEIDVFEFSPLLLSDSINLLEVFYDSENYVYENKNEDSVKITGFLKEIKKEIHDKAPLKKEYIENLLKAVLILSLRNRKDGTKSFIHSDTVLRATLFIWNNLKEKMNAESIARSLGVNPKVLEINFKKLHGRSISSYIRICRINRVTRAIKNSDMNILDIAMENGFTSSSGFYKAFQAVHGMSPKEYIKTLR